MLSSSSDNQSNNRPDTQNRPNASKMKSWLPLIAAILLIVIIGAALLAAHNKPTGSTPSQQSSAGNQPAYKYSTLVPAHVSAGSKGTAITFEKPVEFTPASQAAQIPESFTHKTQSGSLSVLIGDLGATSVSISGNASHSYPKLYAQAFSSSPQSQEYKGAVQPVQAFVKSVFPSTFKYITLSQPKAFTSANIKQNTWQFDFTATDKEISYSQNWQGKVLYLWGSHAYYYWMVAAVDNNWNSNQSVWQQMLGSIKIDQ